jgi:hypothetical protein
MYLNNLPFVKAGRCERYANTPNARTGKNTITTFYIFSAWVLCVRTLRTVHTVRTPRQIVMI